MHAAGLFNRRRPLRMRSPGRRLPGHPRNRRPAGCLRVRRGCASRSERGRRRGRAAGSAATRATASGIGDGAAPGRRPARRSRRTEDHQDRRDHASRSRAVVPRLASVRGHGPVARRLRLRLATGGETTATVTLRVPAERFDERARAPARDGRARSVPRPPASDDVTSSIVDLEARIRNLRGIRASSTALLVRARRADRRDPGVSRGSTRCAGEIEQLTAQLDAARTGWPRCRRSPSRSCRRARPSRCRRGRGIRGDASSTRSRRWFGAARAVADAADLAAIVGAADPRDRAISCWLAHAATAGRPGASHDPRRPRRIDRAQRAAIGTRPCDRLRAGPLSPAR